MNLSSYSKASCSYVERISTRKVAWTLLFWNKCRHYVFSEDVHNHFNIPNIGDVVSISEVAIPCFKIHENTCILKWLKPTGHWSSQIRKYKCICPSKLNIWVLVWSSHNGRRIYNLGLQTYKINAPVPIIYIRIWLGMCVYLTELYFYSVTLDLMH